MSSTIPYVENSTWADDSGGATPITAAKLNAIEQGVLDAHLMPAVRVKHNASQSTSNNTETVLAFNTEVFDKAGGAASNQHDTSTNNSRLICRYAGIYAITGMGTWASNPSNALAKIRLNGTTVIGFSQVAADYRSMIVETLWELAVNDYVEMLVAQASGSALNLIASGETSPTFMMVRVA